MARDLFVLGVVLDVVRDVVRDVVLDVVCTFVFGHSLLTFSLCSSGTLSETAPAPPCP